MMTLGEKIAKLRSLRHLSQGDLAEQVGVSRQSVSKWETGSSTPDLDKLIALSEVFGITLDALVKDPFPWEADPLPAKGTASNPTQNSQGAPYFPSPEDQSNKNGFSAEAISEEASQSEISALQGEQSKKLSPPEPSAGIYEKSQPGSDTGSTSHPFAGATQYSKAPGHAPLSCGHSAASEKAEHFSSRLPTRCIIGYILLGTGLLSAVLGLTFNLLLLFLAAYLILCAIVCFTIRWHPGLIIAWGTYLPVAFWLPRISAFSLQLVFHPIAYMQEMRISLIVSYCFWAVLLVLVFVTIRATKARKHPFLFCGWVIFSQVYGFAPIAIVNSEKALPYYVALSWAVIFLFACLLFFTVRAVLKFRRDSVLNKNAGM